MKKSLIGIAILTAFFSQSPAPLAAEPGDIVLLYSNDLRGEIEPCG
ncbi:MAG: hypothetical protein ACLFV2_03680 [Desulfurivibrionaceae bacterium]